ncbi:MAG: D-sedoheptulose 7-phosphate isomerase [Pseudomonadota bacterium]
MKDKILALAAESVRVQEAFVRESAGEIARAAELMAACLASGHKVLVFGNGGSAADAQHIVAEFVNRFSRDRGPLASIALTTDTSVLTSIANDYDFSRIFARQVRALGKQGDVAWGLSTSGGSKNVNLALAAARELGLSTLGITGAKGGEMAALCDVALTVPTVSTPRIQEASYLAGHILCGLVEDILFPA